MREAVRFIASHSTDFDPTFAARLGRRLVSMGRFVTRAWRGATAAPCRAQLTGVRHPACRCMPEEITGASLQDRWSIAANQSC